MDRLHQMGSSQNEWRKDASIKEIACYSLGGMAGQVGGAFDILLFPILTIALQINPILVGFVLSVKAILSLIIDAQVVVHSDGSHSKRGRRRSFMVVSGLLIPILLCSFWLFFPKGTDVKSNAEMAAKTECFEVDQAVSKTNLTANVATQPSENESFRKASWGSFKEGLVWMQESKATTLYVLFFTLLLAIAQSAFSIPYTAMGMELAPSYNGRSKVAFIHHFLGRVPVGPLLPWGLMFCYLTVFENAVQGAFYLSLILSAFSILGVWLIFTKTRERYCLPRECAKEPFFKSLKTTLSNPEFWRLSGVGIIVSNVGNLFAQIGSFLFLYYLFAGDQAMWVGHQALVGAVAILVAFISTFIVIAICLKRQKHEALQFSISMMVAGLLLKWWCFDPDSLNLMYIVSFFYAFGISGVFFSLSTMMPDVTDVDELRSGRRREGMFVLANQWVYKVVSAFTPFWAGVILSLTGFDVSMGADQSPGVFINMRILVSFVPAALIACTLLFLRKYPLTRKRMEEIQNQIKERELGV